MQIKLSFSLTGDDYFEFIRGYMKHRRSLTPAGQRGLRSPMTVFRIVAVFALMLMMLWAFLIPDSTASLPPGAPPPAPVSLNQWAVSLCPVVGFGSLFLGFVRWFRRSRFLYRSLAAQAIRLGQPRSVEISDGGISIREPGSTSVMEWTYFIRVIETPNTFLLFVTPRMAQIIPKRGFESGAAFEEFRAFAQSHIGNQPIGFPVQPPVAL